LAVDAAVTDVAPPTFVDVDTLFCEAEATDEAELTAAALELVLSLFLYFFAFPLELLLPDDEDAFGGAPFG
jgi:hypothetical protein